MSNKSVRLSVDTQENLSDEQMTKLMSLHERLCWATFLVAERQIEEDDIKDLPEIVTEKDEESPSKLLHKTLFAYFMGINKDSRVGFDQFYRREMERIRQAYINKMQ